jgi:hypothetical protein
MESSSIEGYMIEDEIIFEENINLIKPGTRVPFGCTIKENHLFYSQIADGIIGLGPGKSINIKLSIISLHIIANLIGHLYSAGLIQSPTFSICLALNGGYMSLGDVDKSRHKEPIKYTPIYDSVLYSVKLENISIFGQALEISNQLYTVLDSGTTISYFPSEIFIQISNLLELFCSQSDKCIGVAQKKISEKGICFLLEKNINDNEFISSLPYIFFTFENNLKYNWTPENYIYNKTNVNDEQLKFCMGFISWNSNEMLLGTTFMHNHDIIFDNLNNRIGIAESNCISKITQKQSIEKPECETENEYYNKIIFIHVVCVIFLIFILIILYCRISKGRDFLCLKLGKSKNINPIITKNNPNLSVNDYNITGNVIKSTNRNLSEIKAAKDFSEI